MTAIAPTRADAYQLVHEGALALAQAERYGVRIDVDYCSKKKKHLERQTSRLHKKILKEPEVQLWKKKYRSKFNINSDEQLGDILYNDLGYKPAKITSKSQGTDNEKGSTDHEALVGIDLPFIKMYMKGKKLKKGWDVINGIQREQVNGLIHPNYTLHFTDTFRSSCRDPNLQNVPIRDDFLQKIARTAFIPRKGRRLLEIDYGGIEVHGASWYHKDPVMLNYLNDSSTDMHRDVSADCYKLNDYLTDKEYWKKKEGYGKDVRYAGKNKYTFPQFYGSYYAECARNLWNAIDELHLKDPSGHLLKKHLKQQGIGTYKKFESHIKNVEDDFWNRRFQVYGQWKEDWYEQYLKKGYMDTLTGFRISGVLRKNQIINYPVQGVAFQCLLWSFKELTKIAINNGWKSRPIMQIHDSIIWDVHPYELNMVLHACYDVMIVKLKETWDFIITPIEIEADLTGIDRPWNEKKTIELFDFIN